MTDLSIPNDFSDGNYAFAEDVNENFTSIETFLNTTGVHKYQDGTIPAAALATSAIIADYALVKSNGGVTVNTTAAALSFDATDTEDTLGMHDPSTNNTRVTVSRAGIYSVRWALNTGQMSSLGANSYIEAAVRVNGSIPTNSTPQTYLRVPALTLDSSSDVIAGGCDLRLTAGQYVELYLRLSTGSLSLPTSGGGSVASLSVTRLGA